MIMFRVRDALLYRYGRVALMAALLAVGMALIAIPAQAAIRYVDGDDGADLGTCDTPATACDSIVFAITAANPGDEIRVAEGAYSEVEIAITKQLTLTGGYNPDGPAQWDTSTFTLTPSIVDGGDTHRLLYIAADDVVVQNLTMRNGNATTRTRCNNRRTLGRLEVSADSRCHSAVQAAGRDRPCPGVTG